MWYAFSESAPLLLSMIFSGPTMCADVCSNLSTGHITYLGPPRAQKGPKLAFSQLKPNMTTYLIEQCWNQAGTALRTSRLTSLAHLPDPEYPNYGPRGPKSGPNRLKLPFGHTLWLRGPILGWKV